MYVPEKSKSGEGYFYLVRCERTIPVIGLREKQKTATFKIVLVSCGGRESYGRRQWLKLLYFNEELSVPSYYSMFCCFGQNIQKIDKF